MSAPACTVEALIWSLRERGTEALREPETRRRLSQCSDGRLPGEKQFDDQLRIVLAEPVDKNDPKSVRKLRRIAEKLVECALNGDPWAISQVADRIDGKATAEIQTEQRHRYVI